METGRSFIILLLLVADCHSPFLTCTAKIDPLTVVAGRGRIHNTSIGIRSQDIGCVSSWIPVLLDPWLLLQIWYLQELPKRVQAPLCELPGLCGLRRSGHEQRKWLSQLKMMANCEILCDSCTFLPLTHENFVSYILDENNEQIKKNRNSFEYFALTSFGWNKHSHKKIPILNGN